MCLPHVCLGATCRFEGGRAFFENIEVLLLSYSSSPGDELPTVLSHSPGAVPSTLEDASPLDSFLVASRKGVLMHHAETAPQTPFKRHCACVHVCVCACVCACVCVCVCVCVHVCVCMCVCACVCA